jgi:hypothetical protein
LNVKFGVIMESILVQQYRINLNFKTQLSKNNRPFRLSGISLLDDEIWINKQKKRSTVYWFRYLDKDDFFGFKFNQNGIFSCKV